MATWERIEWLVIGQSLTLWLLKTICIYWVLGWGQYPSTANAESDASGLLGRDVVHYHHFPGLCLWVRTRYEIALLIFSLWASLTVLEQHFQESLKAFLHVVNGRTGLEREAHDAFPPCFLTPQDGVSSACVVWNRPAWSWRNGWGGGGSACVGLQKGCVVVSEY